MDGEAVAFPCPMVGRDVEEGCKGPFRSGLARDQTVLPSAPPIPCWNRPSNRKVRSASPIGSGDYLFPAARGFYSIRRYFLAQVLSLEPGLLL